MGYLALPFLEAAGPPGAERRTTPPNPGVLTPLWSLDASPVPG
jgi:hypothetical protein